MLGIWLFIAAAWFFVDAVHRVPRSEAELAVAPGEWRAWVAVAFLTAILAAMWFDAPVFFAQLPIGENPDASGAGRRSGNLVIAWLVLDWVLRQRWKGAVVEDERDRRIEQVAGRWGRCATVAGVFGIALLLGFSPTARLQQFSYPLLAHLLVAALVLGAWFDHATSAWMHWRDRRALAA